MALSFTVAPLVASSPGSLPGDEATLGGAPICEGAGTHAVADLGFVERGFCSILAREILEAMPTFG